MDTPTPTLAKRGSSRLLMDERPITISRRLACLVGLNESLVLQQTHYSMGKADFGKVVDGRRWIRMTLDDWREEFPFLGPDALRAALKKARATGVLMANQELNREGRDRSTWYSINYAALEDLDCQEGKIPSWENPKLGKSTPASAENPTLYKEESCISSESSASERSKTEKEDDTIGVPNVSAPPADAAGALPIEPETATTSLVQETPALVESAPPTPVPAPPSPAPPALFNGQLVTVTWQSKPGAVGYQPPTPALVEGIGQTCVKVVYTFGDDVRTAHVAHSQVEPRSAADPDDRRLAAHLRRTGRTHLESASGRSPSNVLDKPSATNRDAPTPDRADAPDKLADKRPPLAAPPTGYRWTSSALPTLAHTAHLARADKAQARPLCKALLHHIGDVPEGAEPCPVCLSIATAPQKPKLAAPPDDVLESFARLWCGPQAKFGQLIAANRARIVKAWNQLEGATAEQLDRFGRWWFACDWRAQKSQTQRPTPEQVVAEWGVAMAWNGVAPARPAQGGRPSVTERNKQVLDASYERLQRERREKAEKEKVSNGV